MGINSGSSDTHGGPVRAGTVSQTDVNLKLSRQQAGRKQVTRRYKAVIVVGSLVSLCKWIQKKTKA